VDEDNTSNFHQSPGGCGDLGVTHCEDFLIPSSQRVRLERGNQLLQLGGTTTYLGEDQLVVVSSMRLRSPSRLRLWENY
jgi:hypothetical protein